MSNVIDFNEARAALIEKEIAKWRAKVRRETARKQEGKK